jgi:tubulin monoglycylase TTLL3/8
LDKYLEGSFHKKADFYNKILPKMKHYGSEAVRATYWSLDNARRRHNFELLGLDFMIDEDFHPWLIEVNTNPCLELCCPHLQRIIPSLIENLFKVCVDPLFPPP